MSSHLSLRRQSVKQVKGRRAVGAGRIVNLRPTGEVPLMTTLACLYCTSRQELRGKFPKYVKRFKGKFKRYGKCLCRYKVLYNVNYFDM